MISERNDAGNTGEPFGWSDFFPAILLHLRELAVKNLQFLWQAAGLAMFYFGVPLSRESDDRLEAKIDRLLSEHGIDPAQFDYQEEEGVQAEA
jgi:EAL domain-containing protein (putative c-di-GMP-specific phosphodiesterase class I)